MRLQGLLAGCVALALAGTLSASAAAEPVPLAVIGSPGGGPGQLADPSGVAIDGAGRVYVSDSSNQRVSVFAAGTFIKAFGWDVAEPDGNAAFEVCPDQGACRAGDDGGGAGQLNSALGVTVDGFGNLYVADQVNHRIAVFDTAGPSFVRAFGRDVAEPNGGMAFEVCPDQGACRAGDVGGGAGQLSGPADVALDGAGGLYVADAGNHRISVFDTATLSFTRAFGWGVATGAAAFETCTSTCQMGSAGGAAGQLNTPDSVDLDTGGRLYIADQSNQRIDVFDAATPSFTRAFGWDVADPDGNMAFEVCPTDGACRAGDFGGGAGQLFDPTGVALDGAGGLYVTGFGSRVDVFATAGASFTRAFGLDVADPDGGTTFEVCPTQGSCRLADAGPGPGALNLPIGVEVDCRGAAWVADTSNNRLQRFGEPGTALPPCPATPPPAGGGTVLTPVALAPAENPQCAALRAKLKKAKSKKRKRKLRKRLRKLGC